MRFALLSLLLVALSLAAIRSAAAQPAGPTCSVFDQTVSEANTELAFVLDCDNPTTLTEIISWATSDGTATAPDDYVGKTEQRVVIPGSSEQDIVVDIVGDADPEPDETFLVTLSDPDGVVTFGRRQATGTILDEDSGPSPGPCIVLSETETSASEALSTPSTRRFAGPIDRISISNCGEDIAMRARGTDATGGSATWELTNASSGGPIDSTCELGIDIYRAALILWNDDGGSNEGASLTTQDEDVTGPSGPVVLPAAASRELSVQVEMPCEGSSGLSQPMTLQVTLTAISAP